jgi:hypothetical protein
MLTDKLANLRLKIEKLPRASKNVALRLFHVVETKTSKKVAFGITSLQG